MIIPVDGKTRACTGRVSLSGFCPGALLNPSVPPVAFSAASPALALCPEAPATVSAKLGRPGQRGFRQPEGMWDAWISQYGWCPDTRPGGRADLCLPENQGQSRCPSEHHGWWEEPGSLPASLGGAPPALQRASWPPPGVQPGASSAFQARAVGGVLLGRGNDPGPPDARLLRSVLTSSTPPDCPPAYNSGNGLQLSLRMGRGLNGRKNSRGWEWKRVGRVVVPAGGWPVGSVVP